MFNEYDGAAVTLHSLHLEVSGRVIHIDDLSTVTLQHLGLYLFRRFVDIQEHSCILPDRFQLHLLGWRIKKHDQGGILSDHLQLYLFRRRADELYHLRILSDNIQLGCLGRVFHTHYLHRIFPYLPQICSGQIVNQSFQYIFSHLYTSLFFSL